MQLLQKSNRLVFLLLFLSAGLTSFTSQSGESAGGPFKTLLPSDVRNARNALETVVGKERAKRFAVSMTDCPFETCTEDIVQRKVIFEEAFEPISPAIREVTKVSCNGIKKDQWHCNGPYSYARFFTPKGDREVYISPGVTVDQIAKLTEFFASKCYWNEVASRSEIRNIATLESDSVPSEIKFHDGRYAVTLGDIAPYPFSAVVEYTPGNKSGCEFMLIRGYRTIIRP